LYREGGRSSLKFFKEQFKEIYREFAYFLSKSAQIGCGSIHIRNHPNDPAIFYYEELVWGARNNF